MNKEEGNLRAIGSSLPGLVLMLFSLGISLVVKFCIYSGSFLYHRSLHKKAFRQYMKSSRQL